MANNHSIRNKNNFYLDSSGVVHNRRKLSDILNNLININTGSIKYTILDNKIMIIWGEVSIGRLEANSGGQSTIRFPRSFKDTSYLFVISKSSGGSMWSWLSALIGAKYSSYLNVEFWNNGQAYADPTKWTFIGIGEI